MQIRNKLERAHSRATETAKKKTNPKLCVSDLDFSLYVVVVSYECKRTK